MAYVAVGPNGEILETDAAETLLVRVLRDGAAWEYPTYDQSRVRDAYLRAASLLDDEKGSAFVRFAAENESYMQVRRRRTEAYFERRIRSAEQAIATSRARGTPANKLRGLEGILRNEEESRAQRLSELERNAISVPEETDVAAGLILVETP